MFYTCFGDIMERQILHIDVNNAFLSWTALELLKNGATEDIRKIPSAICGDEQKRTGIILAKSMLAKSFGVVTGETIYQAQRKCPGLKLYSSNYDAYKKYSNALYDLLSEYTYMIERLGKVARFSPFHGKILNTNE
jgi:DNA polymerase-4